MQFFSFLFLPYPKPTNKKDIFILSLFVAIMVFFFLAVFQPFGTYTFQHQFKYLILVPYSVIAFITFSISKVFIKNTSFKRWNVAYELVAMIITLFISSIGNYIYSMNYINFTSFNWYNFIFMFFCTYTVGLPICLIYFFATLSFKMNRLTEVYDKKWDNFIETKNTLVENQTLKFQDLEITDVNVNFIFAKSEGNYCQVFYFDKNNSISKKLIRISLTNFENHFNSELIARCHRSYLINLNQIISKKGNAQGYKLKLNHIDELIPVSRNYLSTIVD
jgi:hypothetical protein